MKPPHRLHFALGLFLLSLAGASAAPPPGPVEVRVRHGDDPRWAAPDWNDQEWQIVGSSAIPAFTGPTWLRVRLARGQTTTSDGFYCPFLSWPEDRSVDALWLAAVFSFDLYWDGHLLERSGVVGSNRATERPGRVDHLMRVPEELRGPGEHVVAVRLSSYHYNFPDGNSFGLALAPVSLEQAVQDRERAPIVPLMLLTGALVIAAMSVVMFLFTDRRRSLLLCHVLSLVLALFYGLVASVFLVNVEYPWFAPRYVTIAALAGVISVLFPWLLAEQFGVLRRGQWLLALAPVLIVAWVSGWRYELKTLYMCRAMLVVSAGILAVAAWRRRPGAAWVIVVPLAGIPLLHTQPRLFLNPAFFVFLELMVLFVFVSLGLQARAERQRARELVLTAARLETELLKRNIQPHFLLNTLATIIEMIEQTPRSAVELIEALASEFRILARVSGEKLIPLAQELELCRAHLEIMTRRKGATCVLRTSGIEPDAAVPPALFHTLVENGLSHLGPIDGEQRFELHAEREADRVRYVLFAHGRPLPHAGRATATGTGTRYIKARLEESYPNRWSLVAAPTAGGWRTVIEIRHATTIEPAAAPAALPHAVGNPA